MLENPTVTTQDRINKRDPSPVTYDYQNEPIYEGEEIIETVDGDILRADELTSYARDYFLDELGLTIKIA